MAPKLSTEDLKLAANTIRGLSMDGVQAANSGHPGMPMGMADVAAVLWLKYMDHCPSEPDWPDRDRFVLSGGHGSMLLYSLLHLAGYDLPLEELTQFRQWGSKTPGHPETGHTPGVETTTGPLGQGCGNSVGMALAERMLADRFNMPDAAVVDHHTYVFAGDGDMMEGLSHEAFSLAGHLGLNKLVLFYDFNKITIEGATELAYSEDVKKRFQSYNWNVIDIDAHDHDQIEKAIRKAQREKNRPTIVICRSHIGFGSPNKQDTASAHGEPLGHDEIAATKQALGMPNEPFYVPEAVSEMFATRARSLKRKMNKWKRTFRAYSDAHPDRGAAWDVYMQDRLPATLEEALPTFEPGSAMATRASGGKVLNSLAAVVPQLVGGAADLAPSTKTLLDGMGSVAKGTFCGRNLHFGVREHAMGSMMNGMALHGGLRVYGATFFVFADYVRPAIRLAAIMGLPVIYVFTHDSYNVGEDGPTHQPVEHLASLRCIPNVTVIRPADPTESAAAWTAALKHRTGPTILALTRQNLPVIDRSVYPAASSLEQGAYTLWQSGDGTPDVIVMASGSEVDISLAAAQQLEGVNVRVVSVPSMELFEAQDEAYRESVLPATCRKRLAVEAGVSMCWHKYTGTDGRIIGLDRFGISAPYDKLAEVFGYTTANVVSVLKEMLG
ncbi:MAG: transketolase [Verrucomicrobia bacterium]|jgi:transketolase|nr:transketolase [Verrucomicrobiota bacterium]MBT7068872.1 transketolase [Verrucomicrobiota bacterium]MBT7702138.1 transketolase [Verrucomicrobiota bacterium]